MKFSKDKEQSIINDYLNGENTVQIAKKWNTYNTSIRRVLLRYNITPRTPREVQSKIKSNPFRDNDEYSEYFLGLLLTDGCICQREHSKALSLSLKDEEMVNRFKDFINPNAKVSKILQKKYNTYMYAISFRSDTLCEWLIQKGNFIDKSNKCDIYVPITWNILRGIFDGDGFWAPTNKGNTMRFGICGKSKVFLEKIQRFLNSYNITSYLHKCNRGNSFLYYVDVYRTEDIIRLSKLMYSDAHIYLMRKYETWHLFEETHREKFLKFKEGAASPNPEPSPLKVRDYI